MFHKYNTLEELEYIFGLLMIVHKRMDYIRVPLTCCICEMYTLCPILKMFHIEPLPSSIKDIEITILCIQAICHVG
jgi:hypothetical protein